MSSPNNIFNNLENINMNHPRERSHKSSINPSRVFHWFQIFYRRLCSPNRNSKWGPELGKPGRHWNSFVFQFLLKLRGKATIKLRWPSILTSLPHVWTSTSPCVLNRILIDCSLLCFHMKNYNWPITIHGMATLTPYPSLGDLVSKILMSATSKFL